MPSRHWQAEAYAALKAAHIRQIGYVPDAGHAHLIEAAHADPDMHAIVLTTEEEGSPSPPAPGWAASARRC